MFTKNVKKCEEFMQEQRQQVSDDNTIFYNGGAGTFG